MATEKVVFVGPAGSGKTQIANRLTNKEFSGQHKSTIAADFHMIRDVNNQKRAQCWDTSGEKNYKVLISMYTRTATIVYIVLDGKKLLNNDVETLGFLNNNADIYQTIESSCPNAKIGLIINKIDLLSQDQRQEVQEKVESLTNQEDIKDRIKSENVFYCSAKNENGNENGIDTLKQNIFAVDPAPEAVPEFSDSDVKNTENPFFTWVKNHPVETGVSVFLLLATLTILVLAVFFPPVLATVMPFAEPAIAFLSSTLVGLSTPVVAALAVSVIGATAIAAWHGLCRIGNALFFPEKELLPSSVSDDMARKVYSVTVTATEANPDATSKSCFNNFWSKLLLPNNTVKPTEENSLKNTGP